MVVTKMVRIPIEAYNSLLAIGGQLDESGQPINSLGKLVQYLIDFYKKMKGGTLTNG